MAELLKRTEFAQVGFIVRDIEETKQKFAALFGVEVPETIGCGEYEVTQTEYKGEAAPEAKCLMAFFDLTPGVQLELIQPNEAASTWHDYLKEHGEGIHHIAFNVQGMKKTVIECEKYGMKLMQKGEYGGGDGRYAYMDAGKDLKCIIELLEND